MPGEDRLQVLPSGPLPPNPSELLSAARSLEIFADLRERADIVVLDSPPVLPVTDAILNGNAVDAVLLVVRVGSSTRRHVGRAVASLRQVEAPIAGAVMNGISAEGAYDYGYAYYRTGGSPRQPRPASTP